MPQNKATRDFISQPKEQKPKAPNVSLSHPENGIKSGKARGLCPVSLWFPGCACPLRGSYVFPLRHPVLTTNLQSSCIQSICRSFVRLQLCCFLFVFFAFWSSNSTSMQEINVCSSAPKHEEYSSPLRQVLEGC